MRIQDTDRHIATTCMMAAPLHKPITLQGMIIHLLLGLFVIPWILALAHPSCIWQKTSLKAIMTIEAYTCPNHPSMKKWALNPAGMYNIAAMFMLQC